MGLLDELKPLAMEDYAVIHDYLWQYQPEISELTFTNLYMWRMHYWIQWAVYKDNPVFVCGEKNKYLLPPVGKKNRHEIVLEVLDWMRSKGQDNPRIERVDKKLVGEMDNDPMLLIEPDRNNFDYAYLSWDLIKLEGNKYHGKKNHMNWLLNNHSCRYEELRITHVPECMSLAQNWCQINRCADDMNLLDEWTAIHEALANFDALKISGGVVFVDDRLEAFCLGELLNHDTAVVHIEKANPGIRGLYAMINQKFIEVNWSALRFINREQDLGDDGLRKAKLSYHPHHLVEKFTITLK